MVEGLGFRVWNSGDEIDAEVATQVARSHPLKCAGFRDYAWTFTDHVLNLQILNFTEITKVSRVWIYKTRFYLYKMENIFNADTPHNPPRGWRGQVRRAD